MRDDRPQVLAQVDFLKHRDRLQKMDLEGRFSYIFEHNLWGSKESRSGIGSTPLETAVVRKEIPVTLRKIGASSILRRASASCSSTSLWTHCRPPTLFSVATVSST